MIPAPLCDYCRTRDADCREIVSASRWWSICFDCLEDLIERENAVALNPGMAFPAMPTPTWRPA